MVKVLIADDSRFMRKLISRVLDRLGIKAVEEASSGEEVLRKLLNMKPDLLILDINMPGINGLELLTKLNSLGINVDVIIISALNQDWALEKAKELGVKAFIPKPFKPEYLARVVSNVLKEKGKGTNS